MKLDGTVALANAQPAPLVGSLITYWQATGNKEALDFAKAYADGMIAGLQPDGVKFQRDGNFGSGHGHMTMHSVWGVAQLGIVTGEERYTAFAKRSWDWMLSKGTGTGWFPAAPEWANYCTEVCLISDMMSTAVYIAEAGYPEYYDYVERCMRNYIANLQFIAIPEFEKRYRELNKAQGEENVEKGLNRGD
jgi:rhamnogalacturonyl hydrolase YesR